MPRVLALLCLTACAFGQELAPTDSGHESKSPKRAAIEKMLSERGSPAEFDKAIAAAKKQGATEQAMLEARFLYLVDRHNDDKLLELLPKFEERKDKFDLADSEIFAVKEDWLAVVEYLEALAALKKNDRVEFKKHITEAFWLSPRQGSAFAPHIDRLRLDDAMKEVKVAGDISLEPLTGDKTTFADLAKDKKAVLLHFWSPWSHECEESMPDFKVVAPELIKNGIAVASLLVESSPEILTDARAMMTSALGDNPPGLWLQGDTASKLSRTMRIQSVPSMVLLSTDGAVLYNGDPSDEALWKELHKIAPGVKRPALSEK
jgi:thiol-disulfide isomerase/thioredoxin